MADIEKANQFIVRATDLSPEEQWDQDISKLLQADFTIKSMRTVYFWYVGHIETLMMDAYYYGSRASKSHSEATTVLADKLNMLEREVLHARQLRDKYTFEEIMQFKEVPFSVLLLLCAVEREKRLPYLLSNIKALQSGEISKEEVRSEVSREVERTTKHRPMKVSKAVASTERFILQMQKFYYDIRNGDTVPSADDKAEVNGMLCSVETCMDGIRTILGLDDVSTNSDVER